MTGCSDKEMPGVNAWNHRPSWTAGILSLLLVSALVACAGPPRIRTAAEALPPCPRIEVYVAPAGRVEAASLKILLAPLRLAPYQEADTALAMTRLFQDILLQHRTFAVVERIPGPYASEAALAVLAADRGFDCVLFGELPAPIIPAGNSPGRVGMDVRLVTAKRQITLWHIFGEAELFPQPARHTILAPARGRPAPTLPQGFVTLARAIACTVTASSSSL